MSIQILHEEWMDSFMEDIQSYCHDKMKDFCNVIVRLGLEQSERNEWFKLFKEQVYDIYDALVEDIVNAELKLIDNIEKLLKESSSLCKMLHIKMPEYGKENLSLNKEHKILQERVNTYKTMVEERQKELSVLYKKEFDLCKQLGYEPEIKPKGPLPTQNDITLYKDRIEALEAEKFSRFEKYIAQKNKIIDLANELNFIPSLSFEELVLSIDDNMFLVTDANMKALNEFYESLASDLNDVRSEIEELQVKVRSLWEILDEDVSKYDLFLQELSGTAMDKLRALRAEYKRCEKVKKANIEVFVKKLRKELVKLWDKCKISLEERQSFYYFHSDVYTEDLLSHHDLEINKLAKYYDENKLIFELYEKWEELWGKMLHLEQPTNSKARYNNRGGKLLQEEKERKAVCKKIPQIEQHLLEFAEDFEAKNGYPFLIWGEAIPHIISKSQQDREQEKKLKLSARKQQKEMSATPGKSALTLGGSVTNLAKSPLAVTAKRKLALTPLIASMKRSKLTGEIKRTGTAAAPPKLQVNNRTILHQRRLSNEKKYKRMSQSLHKKEGEITNSSLSTEYEDFKTRRQAYYHAAVLNDLASKNGCRSTMSNIKEERENTPQVQTPRRLRCNSQNRTPLNRVQTPRTVTKLSVAPRAKLLF